MTSSNDVTQLLMAWSNGDEKALHELMPLIYQKLQRMARYHLGRERSDHTLQSKALVNEAYLRLVDQNVRWQSRAHFFAIAAQSMRRILVDYARSRYVAKRGGPDAIRVTLGEAAVVSSERTAELIALDDALTNLAAFDTRKAQVVELRFFGGLSVEETAEVLKVSPNTVTRDWNSAKAWLHRELTRR